MGVVDFIKSRGGNSSFSARKELAKKYGIQNYTGTALQNNSLLRSLQRGNAGTISSSTINSPNINAPVNINNTNVASVPTTTNNTTGTVSERHIVTNRVGDPNKYKIDLEAYKPSSSVNRYRSLLADKEQDKPDAYENRYTDKIDGILDGIMGRKAFDINTDKNYAALYDTMKESYLNAGNKAMRDTIGNISSLSGGYGNSYAQTVGSQAYDNYLQNLNAKNMELANMAYGMYRDDVNNDYHKLNAVTGLEQMDYAKYRDTMSDYYTDRDYLANRYNNEYNMDYGKYKDILAQKNADRDFAYNLDKDSLSQDNWEREFAYRKEQDALQQALANQRATSSGGSGSGRSGGGSGRHGRGYARSRGSSKNSEPIETNIASGGHKPATAKIAMDLHNKAITNKEAYNRLLKLYSDGLLPEEEFDRELEAIGIDESRVAKQYYQTNFNSVKDRAKSLLENTRKAKGNILNAAISDKLTDISTAEKLKSEKRRANLLIM